MWLRPPDPSVEERAYLSAPWLGDERYETHALDGAAYAIGGLVPVQMLLGTATAESEQTLALAM